MADLVAGESLHTPFDVCQSLTKVYNFNEWQQTGRDWHSGRVKLCDCRDGGSWPLALVMPLWRTSDPIYSLCDGDAVIGARGRIAREGPPTEQRAIYIERRLLLVPLPTTVSQLVRHQSSQQVQLEMTNCLRLKSSNQPFPSLLRSTRKGSL